MKSLFLVLVVGVFIVAGCQPNGNTAVINDDSGTGKNNAAICIRSSYLKEEASTAAKNSSSVFMGEILEHSGDTVQEALAEDRKTTWGKVTLSDGKEGWIPESQIIRAATPGAVMADVALCSRPTIGTRTNRTLSKLDFVAITIQREDGWAEVVGKRVGAGALVSGWVSTEFISTKPSDVAVAVLYSRAMDIRDEDRQKEAMDKLKEAQELAISPLFQLATKK